MNNTQRTDEELMAQVVQGDRMAFEMLYDRYFDKLVWFARGFMDDLQKAEDLVQEVFIKIIKRPELFDTDKKFSTWIYTVTGNVCRNALRDEQNRHRLMEEQIRPVHENSTVIHHQADYHLLKERIKKVLETLSNKERNIYLLRFEQELSIREIAEIMDIPEGSVKSGIYYLLKKFSNHLKEFMHEN
ncbi:MAG: hypothetical protein K0S33_1241 [Bacteroidetes bacterium]|jgi:RNA polymerase sigma-70 factor (ECF subfamily)|nr:hypothetical protein [Bacteroidota bacterium]